MYLFVSLLTYLFRKSLGGPAPHIARMKSGTHARDATHELICEFEDEGTKYRAAAVTKQRKAK